MNCLGCRNPNQSDRSYANRFINQNADWRWTYRVQIIWVFCELVALLVVSNMQYPYSSQFELTFVPQFVPETYAPVILKWKAHKYVTVAPLLQIIFILTGSGF